MLRVNAGFVSAVREQRLLTGQELQGRELPEGLRGGGNHCLCREMGDQKASHWPELCCKGSPLKPPSSKRPSWISSAWWPVER